MKKLKKIYQKISKQTQNKLQEIFNNIDFDFNSLYNIANTKTKKRINTYIEEWKDRGLLKGNFGVLANQIYNKTRVKNSEILELLIYSAYIEQQSKLDEFETNLFKEEINYYYKLGQEEVNKYFKEKKKTFDITDAFFLSLIAMPNVKGFIWQEYIDAITKYNAEQVYRQVTIDLQQQKKLDITNDIYQNLIKRQQNAKLNINGEKISGDIDLTLIGMNNKAKIEGIYSFDKNAKVKFIAVEDNVTTKMCKSLDGQIFNVHDWNEFYRYSKTNDTIKKYRCYGLVQGLNLPPIDDGFHWCRSTIQYINTVENIQEKEYNLDIPKISKDIKPLLKNIELNKRVKKLFNKYLIDENIEINNNLDIPMRYSDNKDKILINPSHPDFKYYDIQEGLIHEIVHMIDKRKNICVDNQHFLETQINLANIEIMNDKQKYYDLFMNDINYELNMTISDIFSAVTNNKIRGAFYHDSSKWKFHSVKYSEVVSNIITADITENLYSLKLIKEIKPLNRIRERLLKEYDII